MELMTREKMAETLQISVRKLNELVEEWNIPVCRMGSIVRFEHHQVLKWWEEMSESFDIQQAGIYLGLDATSIVSLWQNNKLKGRKTKQGLRFHQPILDQFRDSLEDPALCFYSSKDRTENLIEMIQQKFNLPVDYFPCTICKEEEEVDPRQAMWFCVSCNKAICPSHGPFTLVGKAPKSYGYRRHSVCGDCVEKYDLPVIGIRSKFEANRPAETTRSSDTDITSIFGMFDGGQQVHIDEMSAERGYDK